MFAGCVDKAGHRALGAAFLSCVLSGVSSAAGTASSAAAAYTSGQRNSGHRRSGHRAVHFRHVS